MNENKMSVGAFFQKYTMVIALVVVVIFFAISTIFSAVAVTLSDTIKPSTATR